MTGTSGTVLLKETGCPISGPEPPILPYWRPILNTVFLRIISCRLCKIIIILSISGKENKTENGRISLHICFQDKTKQKNIYIKIKVMRLRNVRNAGGALAYDGHYNHV